MILLVTAVPVLIMVIIDLQTILKIHPQIFERAKITITELVTKMEQGGESGEKNEGKDQSPSEAEPAEESEEEISASRRHKLPLLAIRK